MKTFAEIEPIVQATSKDVDNWTRRLELSTAYAETVQGKAKLYSRDNTLELALISAFVKGGATPSRAAIFVEPLIRNANYFTPEHNREWLFFPGGDLSRMCGINSPDLTHAYKELGQPMTLCAVHFGGILRRVDELFAGD